MTTTRDEHRAIYQRHAYAACGTPPEDWVRMGDGGYKQCPKCYIKRHMRRKCLKCDADVIPGCKVGFLCQICAEWNSKHDY